MGHQISKQQNQQMSDDQQMTSSIETHTEPSTSAKDLQVKIGKNRRTTSNAKKSKKQTHQRCDVNSIESKSTSSGNNNTSVGNQERGTGSVVITIRLLKMESARSFDVDSIPNDNYSNNNCPANRSPVHSTSETKLNDMAQNHVQSAKNTIQNQNNSLKMDNNNVNVQQCETITTVRPTTNSCWPTQMHGKTSTLTNLRNCDNGNNSNSGQNSIKRPHVNGALHSKATICDKVQISCTSQSEHSSTPVNSLTHPLNAVNLTDTVASVSVVSNTMKAVSASVNTFIPSNLIGSVSPYPHHIPIANIIRSDCLNAVIDEHSTLCQHAKKDGSGCGKQNGASKETKELKSKKTNWGIKLNCTKLKGIKSLSSSSSSEPSSPSSSTQTTTALDSDNVNNETNNSVNNSISMTQQPTALLCGGNVIIVTTDQQQPWFPPDEYRLDDCDKKACLQRAIEIGENVEPTSGFISTTSLQSLHSMSSSNLQLLPNSVAATVADANNKNVTSKTPVNSSHWTMVCSNNLRVITLPSFLAQADDNTRIHSQVDYIHCLVPDLMQITNCSFYWGKMDRYEAERLLENKPEGTFLLRDSAQEEFLFSVSFRKYGRSLHARIEQLNHRFSFDCHDSSVYTSSTVTGLLEHYKDPGCVMFFEPALTIPLNRNFVFSLQQLCRATIVSHTTYDGINDICLPKKLKSYLKEYHYKQHVRVKRFDEPIYNNKN